MVEDDGKIISQFNSTTTCDECARCITTCSSHAVEVEPDGGTAVKVDAAKCTACEKCVLVCPQLFEMVIINGGITAHLKAGANMKEASKCAFACPEGAIEVKR
jgi:Fe-S-cluster-containing hydrogenase component 2